MPKRFGLKVTERTAVYVIVDKGSPSALQKLHALLFDVSIIIARDIAGSDSRFVVESSAVARMNRVMSKNSIRVSDSRKATQ
jgi:hypothetical protein